MCVRLQEDHAEGADRRRQRVGNRLTNETGAIVARAVGNRSTARRVAGDDQLADGEHEQSDRCAHPQPAASRTGSRLRGAWRPLSPNVATPASLARGIRRWLRRGMQARRADPYRRNHAVTDRRATDQALRRHHRRRRPVVHTASRDGHGSRRAERVGQVDHHARRPRPHRTDLRAASSSTASPYGAARSAAHQGRRTARRQRHERGDERPTPTCAGSRASNAIDDRRADELLDLVGLAGAARRRIGSYSLGMKQRLGIATALLGDPPILVFDEPMNGLDPEGIVWLRGLLRERAAEGRSVMLSSHLMSELEGIADRLVVIKGGRLVTDTTVAELLQHASSGIVTVRTAQRHRGDDRARQRAAPASRRPARDTIEVDGLTPEHVARPARRRRRPTSTA